jgi:hypothetical protein
MSNKKRDKEGRVRSKTVSSFSDDRLPSDLPPEKRQRITESLHDKITHTQQPETPEKTPTKPATSVIDF